MSSRQEQKNVALCFWGLTRSLTWTLPSIEECIFQPLREMQRSVQFTTFLHTYVLQRPYSHRRNGESAMWLDAQEYHWLSADVVVCEDQDEVERLFIHPTIYRTKGDPWENEFESLNHLLCSLFSLHRVTEMMEQFENTTGCLFDLVIFCRPDVWYHTPLSFEKHLQPFLNQSADIGLSNFSEYPVNDRFAIVQRQYAGIYGHRYQQAYTYSLHYPLHSEKFLYWILKSHQLQIHKLSFFFCRIRTQGIPHSECFFSKK